MTEEKEERGSASFCIPKAAIKALIEAKADVAMIGAYLSLAAGTDATGVYSTWGEKAVREHTRMNRDRARNAIERLKTIGIRKPGARRNQQGELIPLLVGRDKWLADHPNESLPDGTQARAKVLHVLADYGEPLTDRIWFGKALVTGVGGFDRPLVALKNAGDIAARMLLLMFERNDMGVFGGVPPNLNVWKHYEPIAEDEHMRGGRLIRSKDSGNIASTDLFSRAAFGHIVDNFWDAHKKAAQPCWDAIKALESSGLVYEMVMVFNRNPEKRKHAGGAEYSDIPADAEPLYELDCRSLHGYKPVGEHGIAGATAKTANDLGASVALPGGRFDGTYAAIVPQGYGAMIAGIYRLRFRPANSKNAGVKSAWASIQQKNREALEFIEQIRKANGLGPLSVKRESPEQQA